MWLAERDACSEARATIRMSRYSLYTAVRRRGGAPGRPLHRSAPPGSARSRSRAARIREIQIARRIVCVCPARLRGRRPAARRSKSRYPGQQRAVVGTVSRARRAVGSRVPIRVVRSWTQRTGRVQWPRGWAAIAGLRMASRLAGGTAAYRLSLIPAIERKNSKLSHIAPRGEPLSFLRRSV
jgi:hypothetical protein